jgi:tRNA(Leu) C34 or U34 (ribose-2'-O)-methylase TrmL
MTRARNMPPPIEDEWPAVCLIRPQMGENIGAVARVLLNFGLVSLRLVAPRDRWPNPKAEIVAVGADQVLKAAKVEWKIEDALRDATLVLAATARPRGLEKPVWGPREAAMKIRAAITAGERPVVMFGPEASGMETDEVAKADAILTLPVNPGSRMRSPCLPMPTPKRARKPTRRPGSPWTARQRRRKSLKGFLCILSKSLNMGGFSTRWTKRR